MLTITTDAATAIKGIVDSADVEGGGLRIYAEPQNDSQASLEIALTPEPGAGDEVVDAEGATVYLEQNAAAYLDDKQLDADIEEEQVRFSITEQPPAV
ncbi:MAG: iron-sulfur cluster biosynthesis family protein [Actinomycetota bacterium]